MSRLLLMLLDRVEILCSSSFRCFASPWNQITPLVCLFALWSGVQRTSTLLSLRRPHELFFYKIITQLPVFIQKAFMGVIAWIVIKLNIPRFIRILKDWISCKWHVSAVVLCKLQYFLNMKMTNFVSWICQAWFSFWTWLFQRVYLGKHLFVGWTFYELIC